MSGLLRSVGPLALILVTGCVDIPTPALDPDARALDRGQTDSAPPDAAPDADPPDVEPIPDLGAFIDDAAPPDADPTVVNCPDPCPSDRQVAVYLPAERADALHVLGDGSILITVTVPDAVALRRALRIGDQAPERVMLEIPRGLEEAGEAGTQVLLHVEPDASAVRAMFEVVGAPIGPIVALWSSPGAGPDAAASLYLVTRHGQGRISEGTPRARRGYAVIGPVPPPGAALALPNPSIRLIPAGPRYQAVPPGAANPAGFIAVDGDPIAETTSQALWFGADGLRVLGGLRHHVVDDAMPAHHFGPPPAEASSSALTLRAGDRCALRTSADEPAGPRVYLGEVPDGNGGWRIGRRPFDAFAQAACAVPDPTPGPLLDPPPSGPHGWSMVPGLSASVAGVAVDPGGASYFGLDALAAFDGAQLRIPALVSYGPDGGLRWFQRLRRDALDGQPVVAQYDQIVRAVALDHTGDRPAVVVAAEGRADDAHPLWTRAAGGAVGFQGPPREQGGSASGWIGRLDAADGRFLGGTWIYRVTAEPAVDRMREGRLGCFIDETRAPGVPQRVQLQPGRIAIGPRGQVAIAGTGVGLSQTPDALQASGAPFESASAHFIRIYDSSLSALIYSTAIGPLPADGSGRLSLDVDIADMRFTPDGDLLVVGHQRLRDDEEAALPTAGAPPWTDGIWPPEERVEGASRAFLLRLVPDTGCGI